MRKPRLIAGLLLVLLVVYLLWGGVSGGPASTAFTVHKQVLSPSDVKELRSLDNRSVKERLQSHPRLVSILERLGPGYEFQDYVFILKKSSIHTCHRDANGDFFNKGQKHPSYTMIVFLEGSDNCLEYVPGSEDGRAVNLAGTKPVPCQAGDAFLFDANVVHAGAIGPDRLRVQLKVTHRDDRELISYYEEYNKVADHDNPLPDFLKHIHQSASCAVPFVSDLVQDEVKQSYTGEVSSGQKAYSQFFYGDGDFYKLKDAF